MQILSNALPGFRDLRNPIIAGYVWLLFGWLIVRPDLDTRPSSVVDRAIWDLGQHIGPIAVGLAVSVAAYLVGSVSQEISSALRRLCEWGRRRFATIPIESEFATGAFRFRDQTIYVNEPVYEQYIRAMVVFEAAKNRLNNDQQKQIEELILSRTSAASAEARRELTLPATLLVGQQEHLFAEVDRLRAEGELRLAIVPPLCALLILLAILQSWFWLLGLPAVLLLFIQGFRREADSRKVIADAIDRDLVTSSALSKFASWVDAVPDRIERTLSASRDDASESVRLAGV
jgi:hypothetical protein